VFVVLALASWYVNRDDVRAGSKQVDATAPLRVTHVPTTYRAIYRVENRAAGKEPVITIEKVWVRRPFASRVETYKNGALLSTRQSAFGVLTSESNGSSAPLNLAVAPSLSSGDLRVDIALAEAVRNKTILRRERRVVYGRACQDRKSTRLNSSHRT